MESHAQPISQPSLFSGLVSVEYQPHESLDERFEKWIAANPGVLRMFIALAEEAQRRGRRKIGGKAIIERLRWEIALHVTDDSFKLNNNYTSRLVRRAIQIRPELAGLFEVRELRS